MIVRGVTFLREIAFVLALALALPACVLPGVWLDTRAVGDYDQTAWFDDGPPMVFTIHNDTSADVDVYLACGKDFHGPFHVPSHSERRALGRLPVKEIHSDFCSIE